MWKHSVAWKNFIMHRHSRERSRKQWEKEEHSEERVKFRKLYWIDDHNPEPAHTHIHTNVATNT